MLLVPNTSPTFLTNLIIGGVLLDFKALDIGQGSRIPIVPPQEVAKPCRFLRELPKQAWYLLSHNKKGIHR